MNFCEIIFIVSNVFFACVKQCTDCWPHSDIPTWGLFRPSFLHSKSFIYGALLNYFEHTNITDIGDKNLLKPNQGLIPAHFSLSSLFFYQENLSVVFMYLHPSVVSFFQTTAIQSNMFFRLSVLSIFMKISTALPMAINFGKIKNKRADAFTHLKCSELFLPHIIHDLQVLIKFLSLCQFIFFTRVF